MRKHSMIRRLGALLCMLAFSTYMWGCSDTVTGPELNDQQLAPQTDVGDVDGRDPGWW